MAINLNVQGNTQPLEAAVQAAVNRIRKTPIKITVDDKGATQPLGNMKRGADEFSKSMEAANARIIAFGASMAIINGVSDAFKAMVKNVVEVEKALADINVVMGLSATNLDKFSSGLFKVAKETAASFDVAAAAATEYARQGLKVEETLKRTKDALILTRLTGMDSANAVKALTAAMNTYGDQIKDTTQLVSKFAAVDVQFAVSAEDFADAISRTGQAAKSAGVDIDELVGLVTAAQQQTARGGKVIGNSFKTIFTRIGRTDTLNQLENLGIAVRDVEGRTLGAKRILTDLANTFDHLSEAQKAQIAQTVGGVFQINVLKAVLSDAAKQNGILANATQISAGATDEAITKNEQLRQTMAAMASETGLALKEVSAQIGEIMLAPGMEKILNIVKSMTEGVGDMLGTGEGAGNTFAKGFLKGLGNIITGPGLVVMVAVFTKLLIKAVQYARDSLKSLIGVTSEAQKQKAIQTSLVTLFGQNAALNKEMLRTDISRTEKEKIILSLLKAQVMEANALNSLTKQMSTTLYSKGYGANLAPRRGKAGGHIPNFADPERQQAARGGYAAGTIRSMNIPGEGSVIYNSAEKVKNFKGMSQPAIMPPHSSKAGKNYQQAFGSIHGFDPYAAIGYVPNFAKTSAEHLKNALGAKRTTNLTNIARGATIGGVTFSQKQRDIAATELQRRASASSKTSTSKTSQLSPKGVKYLNPNSINYIGLSASLGPDIPKASYYVAGGTQTSSGIYSSATAKGFNDSLKKGVPGAKVDVEFKALDSSDKQKAFGKMDDEINSDLQNNSQIIANKILSRFDKAPMKKGDIGKDLPKNKMSVVSGHIFEAVTKSVLRQVGAEGAIADGPNDLIDLGYNKELYELFGIKEGEKKGQSGAEAKLNTTEKNVKSLARKIYSLHTGSHLKTKGKTAASGYIPNFADPLSDAIGRERQAGVPVSQIRVGSHPALMNKSNPIGLGVTNTQDEPNGLRDVFGAANGFVPNYAVGDFLGGFRMGDADRDSLLQSRAEYKATIKEASANEKKLTEIKKQQTQALSRQKQGTSAYNRTQQRLTATSQDLDAAVKARTTAERKLTATSRSTAMGAGVRQRFAGSGMMMMMGASMASGYLQSGGAEKGGTAYEAGGALQGAATGAMMASMVAPFLGPAAPFVVAAGALYGAFDGWNDAMGQNTKALAEQKDQLRQKTIQENKIFAQSLSSQFTGGLRGKPINSLVDDKGQLSRLATITESFSGQDMLSVMRQLSSMKKLEDVEKSPVFFENVKKLARAQTEAATKQEFAPLKLKEGQEYYDSLENIVPNILITSKMDVMKSAIDPNKKYSGTGIENVFGEKIVSGSKLIESVSSYKEGDEKLNELFGDIVAQLEIEDEARKEQVKAVIVQLNLQKAIVAAQQASAMEQLGIKEKYINQSSMLDMQQKLMGGLMSEQQKAQLKYNQSINKAAQAFEEASASADANLKIGVLSTVKSSDPMQSAIKSILAKQGINLKEDDQGKIITDLTDKLSTMDTSQVVALVKELEKIPGLETLASKLLEEQTQKRQNSVDLAQRQKNIAEGQASSELKINSILADRKQLLEDMTDRMKEFKDESDFLTQKGALDKKISAAQRQGTGYISADRQLQIQRSEMEKYTIPQLKREGVSGKTGILSAAAGKLNIGGFSAEEEAQILAMGKNADISEIVKAKKAREFEEANRGGKMQQLTNQMQTLAPLSDERFKQITGSSRESVKAQLESLIELDKARTGRNKHLNDEIEKTNTALKRQNVINNKNVEAVKEEQAARERMRQRMTGPGAFSRGFKDVQGEMRDTVESFNYQLGDVVATNFRDGIAEAMKVGLNGAEDLDEALMQVASNFLSAIQNAFLQNAANAIVSAIPMPGGKSRGGSIRNYSRGGGVPAMVTNGEYVMSGDAVSKYGGAFMHSLNAGGKIPGYANGGAAPGSAIAENFGGGRGFASGRAYQSKAMSSFFYTQSQNVGLKEDEQALMGVLQEEERKRQEAAAKKAKKKAFLQQLLGTALSAGLTAGLTNAIKGGDLTKSAISKGYTDATPKGALSGFNTKTGMRASFAPGSEIGENWITQPVRQSAFSKYNPFNWGMKPQQGPGFASGGHVSGKSGIDQIPAMLSEGEYVIKASSARQLGKPMLDRINAGKYNDGGPVGSTQIDSSTSGGNTNNISISINMEKGQVSSEEKNQDSNPATSQEGGSEKDQAVLAEKIKQQVVSVIVEEQRPGGLLSE